MRAGDLVASYWMGDAIAHTFLSFGFGDDHLAMSIEIRKEVGESYSPIAGLPFSWKILFSGHVPEFAYENGRLAGSGPFAEVRRRARINAAARSTGLGDGFSQRIRAGLPDQ